MKKIILLLTVLLSTLLSSCSYFEDTFDLNRWDLNRVVVDNSEGVIGNKKNIKIFRNEVTFYEEFPTIGEARGETIKFKDSKDFKGLYYSKDTWYPEQWVRDEIILVYTDDNHCYIRNVTSNKKTTDVSFKIYSDNYSYYTKRH